MTAPPIDIPLMAPQLTATLEQTHVAFHVTPENHPLLAYQLVIPKTWAFSKAFGPVSTGPLVTEGLGFFARSADPRSPVIAVTLTAIPFEVPIDAWGRLAFAAEGWQVVDARWFAGALGLFFDVVGTRVRDGVVLVSVPLGRSRE